MAHTYLDHIHSKFGKLPEQFKVEDGRLFYNNLDLHELVLKHGSPLKVTLLPLIARQIRTARQHFSKISERINFNGAYHYAYCLKANPKSEIVHAVARENAHFEVSSENDLRLMENLLAKRTVSKDKKVLINGIKNDAFIQYIYEFQTKNPGQCVAIVDSLEEIDRLGSLNLEFNIGVRISAENEAGFTFANSRFGIPREEIKYKLPPLIMRYPQLNFNMLHFYVHEGLSHPKVYFRELKKVSDLYCELTALFPNIKYLNIGGGFPFPDSLDFDFDYSNAVASILKTVTHSCNASGVEHPDIFTEFGGYTVAESELLVFKIIAEKKQNDKEHWYIIDNSLMTNLPDMWAFRKGLLCLPVNGWNSNPREVFVGGLSCDNFDTLGHGDPIVLPTRESGELYLAVFNTGAYQDALSGFGGAKHCLIPQPKHLILGKSEAAYYQEVDTREEQSFEDIQDLLGYTST